MGLQHLIVSRMLVAPICAHKKPVCVVPSVRSRTSGTSGPTAAVTNNSDRPCGCAMASGCEGSLPLWTVAPQLEVQYGVASAGGFVEARAPAVELRQGCERD